MNIGVLGLGYVGLTFAIAAADCESSGEKINVYGTEINTHVKKCLNENKAHFFEPGLNNLIEKNINKSFFVVDEFPKSVKFDAFMITVGTPLKKGEKTPDFDYIKSALLTIKNVYDGNQLIILRSTVSVGTTRNIVLPYLATLCGKKSEDILLSFCPERTVEGKAIEELKSLPQIISGNNEKSLEVAQKLFRKITPYVIPTKSIEQAEMVKLYNNTYRDIMFSVGNAFCMAAQEFNLDGEEIIKYANMGYSRSNICLPGFVGGPCLEKDAYILTCNMPECESKEFILRARKFNESLEDIVVNWVENKYALKKNKKIAISGLAFKGVPETSDLRGSNSVNIAYKLMQKGYEISLHDYSADKAEIDALKIGKHYSDIYDCAEGNDILLILNNSKRYSQFDIRKLARQNNKIEILDVWNVLGNEAKHFVKINNLGNFLVKE